jgi:hypothetical protein
MSATDHTMGADVARDLMGLVLLPREVRVAALERLLRERGERWLIEALADLVGVANQALANCEEAVDVILVSHGVYRPDSSERANLASLYGALVGIALAEGVEQDGLCAGCAFRVGTPANQSLLTTCDAEHAEAFGERFMCHAGLEEGDQPRRVCLGWERKEGRR